MMLASCTSVADIDDKPSNPDVTVSVSFTGFSMSVIQNTRADEDTTIPENLNRISLAFFDQNNTKVRSLQQSKGDLDEGEMFGPLSVTLPVGEYKLVVVVHEAKPDDSPAIINSPQEVQLASNSIRDTYSTVIDKVTISPSTNSISINMDKRINASFRLKTTDVVPESVNSLWVKIGTAGTSIPAKPTFNPSTGYASGLWKYSVNLTATPGEKFDRSIDVLLQSEQFPYNITIDACNGSTKLNGYSLTLEDVILQRSCATTAEGAFFNRTGTLSFVFDETQATQSITF